MKKIVSILFLSFLILIFAGGCGEKKQENLTQDEKTEPTQNAKIYIPIISKGSEHQFWQAVKKGADEAASKYGVEITFEGPASESEVDKQIEMLKVALEKNPSALCLAALDSKKEEEYVKQAVDRGIPVIGFDSGVDSDLILSSASTDDYAASSYAAGKMAELIGGQGKIAVMCHSETSTQRRDGFVHAIEEKYPSITIVEIEYQEGDPVKSAEATKNILSKHPDIKGIFGTNEGAAVGCVNGLRDLNKTGITIIGFDSGKAQMDAIRNGFEAGAITQNPVGIGYKAVEAAVKSIRGEKVEKIIDTGFYWYDKNNMDDEEIQSVLYE